MLLLDNSAWARLGQSHLSIERLREIAAWMAGGELATCLPFLLEAGYSARSAAEHRAMMSDLRRLPMVEITSSIETRALHAHAELAFVGHHRVPPTDLIVAACADAIGGGVLHYDGDFEIILERTSLTFQSAWLAPRGTL